MKYAVLFGFRKSDIDDVGYLSESDGRIAVQKDRSLARRFSLRRKRGEKGWASPEKWRDFFNEDMPEWKFHVIRLTEPANC